MEPISNIDRVVLLLKQRLEQRSRAQRQEGAARRRGGSEPQPGAQGITALAALAGVDERQLRRTFVQTLLADQLGADLVNDAQFQQIVSRVASAIEADADAARLLTRVLGDARAR